MIVGLLRAPDVVELHLHVDGDFVQAIEERDFVRRSQGSALGARAVVAVDVDDQRVVEPAKVFESLDHAADLVVAIRCIGGEHLDLPDEEFLRLRGQFVPWLEEVLRPRRQLRILRDDTELLLVLEDALAQLLVAVVEKVHRTNLVHPFLCGVVRCVCGARRVLDENRLVRLGLVYA